MPRISCCLITHLIFFIFYGSASASEDYAIELFAGDRVVGVIIPPDEYQSLYDSATAYTSPTRKNITRFLYNYFRDEFDYIFLIGNNDTVPPGLYYGLHSPVRNTVSGIGRSFYNYSSSYGSSGTLKGVIDLPFRDGIRSGPSLHELVHSWANYIITTSYNSHWGFSSAGGQLGGFVPESITEIGVGVYQADNGKENYGYHFAEHANGGNSILYSPIELYLMGVLPPEEVPVLKVAQNPSWVDFAAGTFEADGFTDYTIADIVHLNGTRSPAFPDSQNHFKILVVLVSSSASTESEQQRVTQDAADFSFPGDDDDYLYNFWEATGGRATLSMDRLSHSLIDYTSEISGAILTLKLISGNTPLSSEYKIRDIDGNDQIGLVEAIFSLRAAAGLISAGPIYPNLELDRGKAATIHEEVPVMVSAYDPVGITGYYLSLDPSIPATDGPGWYPVSPAVNSVAQHTTFSLGSQPGVYTVYCWFKNSHNDLSESAEAQITLFTEPAIFNVSFDPPSPAVVETSDKIYVTFDYAVPDQSGAYIEVKPFSGTRYTSGGYYQTSNLVYGTGTTSRYFYVINEGNSDQVRLFMETEAGATLYDEFVPVDFSYVTPPPEISFLSTENTPSEVTPMIADQQELPIDESSEQTP